MGKDTVAKAELYRDELGRGREGPKNMFMKICRPNGFSFLFSCTGALWDR